MKTNRENLLSLLRREGYDFLPPEFSLCPSLEEEYKKQTKSDLQYPEYFNMPWKRVRGFDFIPTADEKTFRSYYPFELKEGTHIDALGVAHEPGSEAAKHMTYMRNPMKDFTSLEQFKSYPYHKVDDSRFDEVKKQVEQIHKDGYASLGDMQTTIWETAWYMRGMNELMMDMMADEELSNYHFDRVTKIALRKAELFAKAGVDIIFLGDDIGMQSSIMMSKELYSEHIKYRLKKIIDKIREIKPDTIIFYHSCGYVEPFIPDLIEVGIDVLNPVQPECMDFEKIFAEYKGALSFHGTVGTQSVMPFGTPDDVRDVVRKNVKIAGNKGGLFIAPTHLLEPEVPWENIMAYVNTIKEF